MGGSGSRDKGMFWEFATICDNGGGFPVNLLGQIFWPLENGSNFDEILDSIRSKNSSGTLEIYYLRSVECSYH
jgi:hypothetical protein